MKMDPVPNHPGYMRGMLGVWGPERSKARLLIVMEGGQWCWRYQRPGERHCVFLGPVSKVKSPASEAKMADLMSSIY